MEKNSPFQIWVDADACPNPIKQILFKAANRLSIHIHFVANHFLRLPPSPFIHFLSVQQGFDIADQKIIELIQEGELLITQDILLAELGLAKKALILHPKGFILDEENIASTLSRRQFNEILRESGLIQSKTAALHPSDINQFASALDRILSKKTKMT